MSKTPEQLKSELMMYGCDIDQFKQSVTDSFTYKNQGGAMIIASLLSDAQEMIERDWDDTARQYINRAKYLLFEGQETIIFK